MKFAYKRGKGGLRAGFAAVLCLALVLAAGTLAFAAFSDVTGHWAASAIAGWSSKGLVSGYPDGTFKPDNPVTRAEFVTLVNRAFGFAGQKQTGFSDVAPGDWYAAEVAKAAAAGYITGYEDNTFRPQNAITRQEAAAIICRVKGYAAGSQAALAQFSDAADIGSWARAAAAALVEKGLVRGYPDGTFKPNNSITRAEAVVLLDRALKAEAAVYDKAGTYGPETGTQTIDGSVTVSASGVTLQNLVITGDLILAEGIGEGDVTLKNVTVEGDTVVKGGGGQSVVFENCRLAKVIVNKSGVRIVARGSTLASSVVVNAAAAVVNEASAAAFKEVVVTVQVQVTLAGSFEKVAVEAPADVKLTAGSVQNLEIASTAQNATVNLASGVTVSTLTVNAAARVTGTGTIVTANINASGTTVQPRPQTTNIASGVSASVGTGTTGGGGGGGGGRDTTPPRVTDVSITLEFSGDSEEVSIPIDNGTGSIDLRGRDPKTMLKEVAASVSENCTLELTGPEGVLEIFNNLGLDVEGDLIASEENVLNVTDYLDNLDPQQDGVSLAKLAQVFGTEFTMKGTLTDASGNTSNMSISITLPD